MMSRDWVHDLRCTSQAHAHGFEPLTGRITALVTVLDKPLTGLSEGLSEAPLLHSSDSTGMSFWLSVRASVGLHRTGPDC